VGLKGDYGGVRQGADRVRKFPGSMWMSRALGGQRNKKSKSLDHHKRKGGDRSKVLSSLGREYGANGGALTMERARVTCLLPGVGTKNRDCDWLIRQGTEGVEADRRAGI